MSEAVRPKVNTPDGAPIPVRLPNGDVVLKQNYTNGNYRTTNVRAEDYPDAKVEAPKRKPKDKE